MQNHKIEYNNCKTFYTIAEDFYILEENKMYKQHKKQYYKSLDHLLNELCKTLKKTKKSVQRRREKLMRLTDQQQQRIIDFIKERPDQIYNHRVFLKDFSQLVIKQIDTQDQSIQEIISKKIDQSTKKEEQINQQKSENEQTSQNINQEQNISPQHSTSTFTDIYIDEKQIDFLIQKFNDRCQFQPDNFQIDFRKQFYYPNQYRVRLNTKNEHQKTQKKNKNKNFLPFDKQTNEQSTNYCEQKKNNKKSQDKNLVVNQKQEFGNQSSIYNSFDESFPIDKSLIYFDQNYSNKTIKKNKKPRKNKEQNVSDSEYQSFNSEKWYLQKILGELG